MSAPQATALNEIEAAFVRRALGLANAKAAPGVNRNRVACHDSAADIEIALRLEAAGIMQRFGTADYASMRVFRVTTAGASTVGKKLPRSLQ